MKFEVGDQAQDLCAGGNEELAQGYQVCVKDFGNPRAETKEAGLLVEGEGVKMDTSCCLTKERHLQCLRCEMCSPYVNKSYFSFWDSPRVDPDFAENGMDEFGATRGAWTRTVSEVSAQERSAEDGNVKSVCMRSWRGELRGSGSGHERGTRVDEGERRRQEMTTGGESKRIYARRWEGVQRMSKEELVRLAKDESSHVYVVYGGRIMTPETINRLKDDAIVRVVDRMVGGGRKKKAVPKNTGGEDLSATEESSSSTLSSDQSSWMARFHEVFRGDAVEQMKSIASTRPGGGTEAWARKVMEVGEEGEEEVLGRLHRATLDEVGHVAAKTMIDGILNFVREQGTGGDRRMKDVQEERRRRWEKDGEMWEPAGLKTGKETAEDARGDEPAVVEETGKGGKGVGMSGGWFWQTAQQWQEEEVEQEAAQRRQQEEAEQVATRQQQQEEVEREAARRQQRQQEEAARQQRQQQEEEVRRQQVDPEELAGREGQRRRQWEQDDFTRRRQEEERRRAQEAQEQGAGGARGAGESAGSARRGEESAGSTRERSEGSGGARKRSECS